MRGAIVFTAVWTASAYGEWKEYADPQAPQSSGQLTLVTDLSHKRAAALWRKLHDFEHVVRRYLPVAAHEYEVPDLRVVVFSHRRTFDRVVRQRHFAAYTEPGISGTTLVVGPDKNGSIVINALHEYVHYRLRTLPVSLPLWFEEGLASVLSSARLPDPGADERVAEVGHRIPAALAALRAPTPTLPTLVTTNHFDGWSLRRMNGFYKLSARLVHYLVFDARVLDAPPENVHRYFAARDIDFFAAFDTSADRLGKAVAKHARKRNRPADTIPLPEEPELLPEPRALSPEELLRLQVRTAMRPNPAYAARLAGRLREQYPDNALYAAWQMRALLQTAPEQAAAVVADLTPEQQAHPQVLLQRALTLLLECPLDQLLTCVDTWRDAGTLLRQALNGDPDDFNIIAALGVTELYSGNPGAAVNYLRIAHTRAPWAPRINYHYGECLRLLGNPRAREHLLRARAWAREASLARLAELSLETLERTALQVR